MNDFAPVLIAALLCAFVWLRNRLSAAIQPKRLELAQRGETLLANPALNAEAKSYVRFLLDHAFGMRMFLIFGLFMIPAIVLIIILKIKTKGIREIDLHSSISNKEARLDLIEFEKLHEDITWANNPLIQTVIEIEYFVVVFIAFTIILIFAGSAQIIGKDTVIWMSEKLLAKLQRQFTTRTA
jgi:hypothetical protein